MTDTQRSKALPASSAFRLNFESLVRCLSLRSNAKSDAMCFNVKSKCFIEANLTDRWKRCIAPNRRHLAALLCCTALTVAPLGAQEMGTGEIIIAPPPRLPPLDEPLGMLCDRVGRTPDGRIALGDTSAERVTCEAYRATALTYARLLETTRNRIEQALRVLPPPLVSDLITHLQTDAEIGNWQPDPTDLARLEAAARRDPANLGWLNGLRGFWGNGVLGGTGIDPAAWNIRARAQRNVVVVWLEPETLRDSWSPAMVQRAVEAWYSARPNESALERTPKVIEGGAGAPVVRRIDGDARLLPGLFDTMDGGTQDLPRDVLAMDTGMSMRLETDRQQIACPDPGEVGYIRQRRQRRNGIFVDLNGEALFDAPGALVAEADAWQDAVNTCRAPRDILVPRAQDCRGTLAGQAVTGAVIREFLFRETRDPTDPTQIVEWPVNGDGSWNTGGAHTPQPNPRVAFCEPQDFPAPEGPDSDETVRVDTDDCQTAHGGRFDLGERNGFERRITYPADWGVQDVVIAWTVDACFRAEPEGGDQTRPGQSCPAGHTGRITEGRRVSWWNRDWVDPRQATGRGDLTLTRAAAIHDADPAQSGRPWFERVDTTDWEVTSNTCRQLPADNDGNGPGGGNNNNGGGNNNDDDGPTSFDVDGDGRGDYRDEHHARREMGDEAFDELRNDGDIRTGREVQTNCGSCDGPDSDDDNEGGDDNDGGGGGGFWDDVSDLWDSITGGGDDDDDDSGGGGGGDSGGGCFLTTAIVERRGEADDGPTLTALRAFRDGWMAHHPDGPALVAEYYDIAPRIVAAIPDDHTDWTWIGARVDAAVRCLERSDPEGAFEVYTDMVRHLKAKWLEGSGHPVHWKKESAI